MGMSFLHKGNSHIIWWNYQIYHT